MLKLKLQYFSHLMWRRDTFEKTLMLGNIEGRRRRGQQKMRWLDGIIDSMDMGLGEPGSWWWTGRPGILWFMWSQRFRHVWATELNWGGASIWKYRNSGEKQNKKNRNFYEMPKFEKNCEQEHINLATKSTIGGEGNGTPLQYSCLENSMDGGAWWAAIYGVT